MRTIALIALLALGACATKEKFEAKMLQPWLGKSEAELVAGLGTPDGFYEVEGMRFLSYKSSRVRILDGTPPTATTRMIGTYSYTTVTPGSGPTVQQMSCSYQFKIVEKKVESYSYKGNDCTAL